MTLQALLADVAARGITLAVDGEELRVRAAKGVVDAALRAALLHHKPVLLDLLRQRDAAAADADVIPRVPRDGVMPLWNTRVIPAGISTARAIGNLLPPNNG